MRLTTGGGLTLTEPTVCGRSAGERGMCRLHAHGLDFKKKERKGALRRPDSVSTVLLLLRLVTFRVPRYGGRTSVDLFIIERPE